MQSVATNIIENYLHLSIGNNFTQLIKRLSPVVLNINLAQSDEKEQPYQVLQSVNSYRKTVDDISKYQRLFKQNLINPAKVKEELESNIKLHIDTIYKKINVDNADINYFLEHICENNKIKFISVIDLLEINHIIKMLDYGKNDKTPTTFKCLMDDYYKLFNNQILNGKYGKSNKLISDYMGDNWNQISFENLLAYSEILSKLKYYKSDLDFSSKYELIFQNKFDDISNITKLLDYIKKTFILRKEDEIIDINELTETNNLTSYEQYNFRYIIETLKSNGFLLFEQYFKDIQSRYANQNQIDILYKDIKITKYFITIISQKENTSVNRYVNEMLIKTREYLLDLMDSHYNNIAYKKIKVRATSDKYKNVNMESYLREITNFKVFKYNFCPQTQHTLDANPVNPANPTNPVNPLIESKEIPINLAPYLDMYTSYYKARFPDRKIEYDLVNSTIIVKMKFGTGSDIKQYFIHMAILQYIVLDQIMKGIINLSVLEISEKLGISLEDLTDTFNSLLKIKIIKRKIEKDNIYFAINDNFSFEKNKLSISGLIKKDSSEEPVKIREFLHDRQMIVLANLIYWAKKTKYFAQDVIHEALVHVIPFKLTDDNITNGDSRKLSAVLIYESSPPPS